MRMLNKDSPGSVNISIFQDPDLRPALVQGQFASRTTKKMISQKTGYASLLENRMEVAGHYRIRQCQYSPHEAYPNHG